LNLDQDEASPRMHMSIPVASYSSFRRSCSTSWCTKSTPPHFVTL